MKHAHVASWSCALNDEHASRSAHEARPETDWYLAQQPVLNLLVAGSTSLALRRSQNLRAWEHDTTGVTKKHGRGLYELEILDAIIRKSRMNFWKS